MKLQGNITLAFLLSLFLIQRAFAAIELTDDDDFVVRLDRPASRIISLAPSLTELVFAAGAGEKLVGVVEYSDFPPEVTALPIVGRYDLLDLERILELEPDLIVAWQSGNPRASVARLRELGLTIYTAEPKKLETIATHIKKLSMLAGTESEAAGAIELFEKTYEKLRNQFSYKSSVRTFYQIWDVPLMTSGGNELINDIINLCGGQNIFSDLKLLAPKVSIEAVLVRNPEVIIASGMDIDRPEWLDDWKQWPGLTAVQKDNLYFIPPELLQRHTPRALLGAQQMCEHIDRARQTL